MDFFSVPERAIEAFERLTATRVTVHDLRGSLQPFLPPERFQHMHPLCCAMKINHSDACIDFDATRLRREISAAPEGRVQMCFAGLVECVVPVFQNRELDWVLFAGPRLRGTALSCATRDDAPPPRTSPWPCRTPLPSAINDAEAQSLLENLRQLAARLQLWHAQRPMSGAGTGLASARAPQAAADPLATRRAQIRSFIHARHTQPVRLEDLAEVLHLSESRAGHAVREACGKTFLKLLTEARLRTAAGLLQHTNVPVLEVGLRSGFGEISHFHRSFRTRFKLSPLQYRKQSEAARV